MEEEKNEKFQLFIKIILLLIAYSIIGICGLFFILVSKVKAASSIMGYNSGGADLTSCYDCYELNTNKNYYDFNYDYSYQNSTNVNLQFNNILTFRVANNGNVNIGAPSIIVANGYLTYDISSYCTEVVGIKTITEKLNYTEIVINYAFTCDIPNYSGNFPNYRSLKVTYTRSLVGAPIFTYSRAFDNGFTIQESPYQQDVSGDINAVGGNIINNQNQNTQSIINNNNSNTQSIIDNQNQNTQQVTDAIEKQNIKCENYNLNINEQIDLNGKALTSNGSLTDSSGYNVTKYIAINGNKTYTYNRSWTNNAYYCLYGEDKSLIQCSTYGSNNLTILITPQTQGYIRFTIRTSSNHTNKLTGEHCYNLLEKQNQTQQEQYDYLTDNTPADTNIISGIQVTPDTPISSLLTLPIRLVQSVLDNLNGQCADYSFGTLYNYELKLKCSDIRYIPTLLGNYYNIIDYLMAFFMIYNIFMLLIHAYETITTLSDDFHNIYETKTYYDGRGFTD